MVLNERELSLLKCMLSIKIFPVIKAYAVTRTGCKLEERDQGINIRGYIITNVILSDAGLIM